MDIDLNRPMLDWLSLTSYDGRLAKRGMAVMDGLGEPFARQVICYTGLAADGPDGGIFVGTGEQGGKYHAMVQLSGGLSDRLGPALIAGHTIGPGAGNCSRIDLQITVTGRLDIDCLAADLVGAIGSQVTIYRTLQGGQVGDTLYIGSPKSDKRIRLYHKGGATRFEVQYRREYALSVFGALKDTGSLTIQQVIAGHLLREVSRIRHRKTAGKITWLIHEQLQAWADGEIAPTSNTRAIGDRERWLRTTVMNALVAECQINDKFKRDLLSRLYNCSPITGEIKS